MMNLHIISFSNRNKNENQTTREKKKKMSVKRMSTVDFRIFLRRKNRQRRKKNLKAFGVLISLCAVAVTTLIFSDTLCKIRQVYRLKESIIKFTPFILRKSFFFHGPQWSTYSPSKMKLSEDVVKARTNGIGDLGFLFFSLFMQRNNSKVIDG